MGCYVSPVAMAAVQLHDGSDPLMLAEGLEMLSEPGLTSLTAAAGCTLCMPHGSAEGVRAVRLPHSRNQRLSCTSIGSRSTWNSFSSGQ
eukprot:558594-Lingulodinium_polyedra.AAC.1